MEVPTEHPNTFGYMGARFISGYFALEEGGMECWIRESVAPCPT